MMACSEELSQPRYLSPAPVLPLPLHVDFQCQSGQCLGLGTQQSILEGDPWLEFDLREVGSIFKDYSDGSCF